MRTWEGFTDVATVSTSPVGSVVALATADHLRSSLISEALQMAIKQRQPAPGLLFHSDRGCQYTATEFRHVLSEHGIVQSLSRPRQCWDNAVAESFFSTLKEELLYRRSWPTRTDARQAIFDYVEVFFHRQRLHSALDYLSPVASEARQRDANHD